MKRRLSLRPETSWAVGLYVAGVMAMAVLSYGLTYGLRYLISLS